MGVMPTEEALAKAAEEGLDLVEVSPTARPPVCRIMDFGKYKYEQNKKQKQSKKKQHTVQVKEVKLRPKTEEHDYQFKKRHAEEFLEKHHKVKITLLFRGRELDHKELGMRILKRMEVDLAHVGVVERPAQFEGRIMVMYMAPHAGKVPAKKTAPQPKEKAAAPTASAEPAASAAPAASAEADTGEEEGTNAQTQNE